MAFYSLDTLVQRTIVRLRQVAGAGTQLYSEDLIAQLIEEVYEMVRTKRWWDHLMVMESRQLDGSTGVITSGLDGAREGYEDIQWIKWGTNSVPLPQLSSTINPYKLSGTTPRYVEPLHIDGDPTRTLLFRVWPLASVTTVALPIRIRYRKDPTSLFTDSSVVVPFDATCLVNGAAAKFAMDEAVSTGTAQTLQQTFVARLGQLELQHDSADIILDDRTYNPYNSSEWVEGF